MGHYDVALTIPLPTSHNVTYYESPRRKRQTADLPASRSKLAHVQNKIMVKNLLLDGTDFCLFDLRSSRPSRLPPSHLSRVPQQSPNSYPVVAAYRKSKAAFSTGQVSLVRSSAPIGSWENVSSHFRRVSAQHEQASGSICLRINAVQSGHALPVLAAYVVPVPSALGVWGLRRLQSCEIYRQRIGGHSTPLLRVTLL